MRKLFIFILIIFSLIFFSCAEKPTETTTLGSVHGTVFDQANNSELSGVTISIQNIGNRTTNNQGYYEFLDLTENIYTIIAEKSGYVTETAQVEIEANTNKEVNFTINAALPAHLLVNPTNLNFGQTVFNLNLAVNNGGDEELSWQVTSDQSWLTTFPTTGTTITEEDQITVTVNRAGLEVGSYTGNLSFTSNGGNFNVPVQMEVTPIVLIVNPLTLDFGEEETELSFEISNTGNGILNWSLTPNQNWLTANPTSGSLTNESETITVYVDRAGLASDSYNGSISITSNGGNQDVNIAMIVPEGPAPSLVVTPGSLEFGSTLNQSSFEIQNAGEATLNWDISDNQNWISVYPTGGSINSSGSTTINVSVDRTGLSFGSYNGSVSVTSDGGNEDITISMYVPFLDTFENLINWSVLGWELDTTNWSGWDAPTVVCTDITGANYLSANVDVVAGQTLSFRLKVWDADNDNTSVKLFFNNVLIQEWFKDGAATNWTYEYNPEIQFTSTGMINIKFEGNSEAIPVQQIMRIDDVGIN